MPCIDLELSSTGQGSSYGMFRSPVATSRLQPSRGVSSRFIPVLNQNLSCFGFFGIRSSGFRPLAFPWSPLSYGGSKAER
jgi:hypothetical protein